MKKIIPAILSDDIGEVRKKIELVKGFADWVQIDIADNKFVPNKTVEVRELKGLGVEVNLELHLMVHEPQDLFRDCALIGAKRVIIHFEALGDIDYTMNMARQFDFELGIAINPKTPVSMLKPFVDKVELILLLAVEPGFGGQKFVEEVLKKVSEIEGICQYARADGSLPKIGIDGGVNHDTIALACRAGVDLLVVGSALFDARDLRANYERLVERVLEC